MPRRLIHERAGCQSVAGSIDDRITAVWNLIAKLRVSPEDPKHLAQLKTVRKHIGYLRDTIQELRNKETRKLALAAEALNRLDSIYIAIGEISAQAYDFE